MNDERTDMDARPDADAGLRPSENANDRFKKSFSVWFWSGMIAATAVHFAIFAFWPQMVPEDVGLNVTDIEAIEIPPEVEIPPPPEAIARPATPVIAEATIDQDITIEPTTFEDNPVENLPPPPDEVETDISDTPRFTPLSVQPAMLNRPEIIRTLEREYPPLLRDAGIGGTVVVWFLVDETGRVKDTRIATSSDHAALDAAALRVANVFRFSPPMNMDKAITAWVTFPITFETR